MRPCGPCKGASNHIRLFSLQSGNLFFIFRFPSSRSLSRIYCTSGPPPRPHTAYQIVGSYSQLGRLLPTNTPVRLEADGRFYHGSYTALPNRLELDSHPSIRDFQRWHRSPWLSLHQPRPRRRHIGCMGRRSREEGSRTSRYSPIREERERERVELVGMYCGAKQSWRCIEPTPWKPFTTISSIKVGRARIGMGRRNIAGVITK